MNWKNAVLAFAGFISIASATAGVAAGAEVAVTVSSRPDLKAVFGEVESRDVVSARARIGGTITSLAVEEGSSVKAGDVIALVVDEKLALQLAAVDARLRALQSQLDNAATELDRAQRLLKTGVVPKNRVDQLQTEVNVLTNQISAANADRGVLEQQQTEGDVIAPAPGRVLSAPVTKGSVILPGEAVARIAGGGYFLRLSLPERHAAHIKLGDDVLVGSRGMMDLSENAPVRHGKVVKVYPEITDGRVLADVEVDKLGDFFVGERTRVWIPVATRTVVSVPRSAVVNRHGIDYVRVAAAGREIDVPIITGASFVENEGEFIEILSGVGAGDKVMTP